MKTKLFFFLAIGVLLTSCNSKPTITPGMVKMTIFYPKQEGSTFNMDYYSQNHMPMAVNLLGDALKVMAIDKGFGGANPGDPAIFEAIGYFYFENMESFQEAMAAHSATLKADVPNYTNIVPQIQISTVTTFELP